MTVLLSRNRERAAFDDRSPGGLAQALMACARERGGLLEDLAIRPGDAHAADLKDLRLRDVEFDEVILTGAGFSSAAMSLVKFSRCNLDDADLRNVAVAREGSEIVVFDSCRFARTRFEGADLACALLESCTMEEADLTNALLGGLRQCELRECVFVGTRLRACDGTVFSGVMRGCDFAGARLRGCDFERVHFVRCDFRDGQFHDCDLTGAIFEDCNLDRCNWVNCTVWLDGLVRVMSTPNPPNLITPHLFHRDDHLWPEVSVQASRVIRDAIVALLSRLEEELPDEDTPDEQTKEGGGEPG